MCWRLGGLFGPTLRLRAAALALLQAVAFAALTDPWVHGALLMVFVVAGLGLFVMLSWLLARLLAPRPLPLPPDRAGRICAGHHHAAVAAATLWATRSAHGAGAGRTAAPAPRAKPRSASRLETHA